MIITDLIIHNHELHIKGKTVNQLAKTCNNIYMRYNKESDFEVAIKNCVPDTLFPVFSYSIYPFKLVILPKTLDTNTQTCVNCWNLDNEPQKCETCSKSHLCNLTNNWKPLEEENN